jgi:hypothetical protein
MPPYENYHGDEKEEENGEDEGAEKGFDREDRDDDEDSGGDSDSDSDSDAEDVRGEDIIIDEGDLYEDDDSDSNSDSDEEDVRGEDIVIDDGDEDDIFEENPPFSGHTNPFNPTGALNNCTDMGEYYASGLPNEYSPPPADRDGRDLDEWKKRLAQRSLEFSTSPPDEEYMENEREVAFAYYHREGGGHVVAMNGGYNAATYMFADHQVLPDEDVTGQGRDAIREGRVAGYITKPNFEDWERRQMRGDDDEEEEGEKGEYADDANYDCEGDFEMDDGERERNKWYGTRG